MDQLSVDNGRLTPDDLPMQLNQIARVVLTTAKELFFDPYQKNKATGAFILIDPITNNTSAVGMIIDRVEDKDMHLSEDLPVLNLPKLEIAPEHYEAIEKAVRFGFEAQVEKEIDEGCRSSIEEAELQKLCWARYGKSANCRKKKRKNMRLLYPLSKTLGSACILTV